MAEIGNWKKRNPDRMREYRRNWKKRNPDQVRTEAREHQRSRRKRPDVRANVAIMKKKWTQTIRGWASRAYTSCKRRGLEVTITKEDIVGLWHDQQGYCALLKKIKMEIGSRYLQPSLDRIDSSKGYHLANVRLVCWWVNLAKTDLSDTEFLAWCRLVTYCRQ